MGKKIKIDGLKEAAEALQGLDQASRKRILQDISLKDPLMAQVLEKRLLSFEDLIHLTSFMIQSLLKDIKIDDLSLALRGAGAELRKHFLDHVSKNIRFQIIETLNGPKKKLSEVQKAQDEIMKVVRAKVECGELVLDKEKSKNYV